MNENYEREIDLIDLFIDWLSHWKSFIVFLLVGIIISCGYLYLGSNSVSNADAVENELSKKDIIAVDDVIALCEEYEENLQFYESQKNQMEIKDRVEAFNYIVSAKNFLEERKAELTADQLVYYYAKSDISTAKSQEKDKVNTTISDDKAVVKVAPSKSKALLIVILVAILHFIISACRYMFDNTVKHTDNLSLITNVPEYTRMINWDRINANRGLDKLVCNMRFAGVRRTSLADTIEINASATIEKMQNKNYKSIALVGADIGELAEKFTYAISKADSSKIVKSIDSITHSVTGADNINGVKAAILAVKVGTTRYNDLMEELQSLRDREVEVIGIAVFE